MTPILVLVLILSVLVLTLLALAFWISIRLLHGRRQPLARTPGEYGLEYENITFLASDGLALKGWSRPNRTKRIRPRLSFYAILCSAIARD